MYVQCIDYISMMHFNRIASSRMLCGPCHQEMRYQMIPLQAMKVEV